VGKSINLLSQISTYNYLLCAKYQFMENKRKAFERLLNIMDELREKCPWDKKQTIQSLRKLTIEETYELADAIIEEDYDEIKKELGDLMLHIVFYAKIGEEQNKFNISDVLNSICEKLIVRHPHVFADVKVNNAQDVSENWEQIKLNEGKTSVLQGVPNSLPALVKANRIQEKVQAVGFDWENTSQVIEKVKEEIAEFEVELQANNKTKMEAEMGDLLFSLVNLSRFLDIDPETALEKTNKKFTKRFLYLEGAAKKENKKLNEMSLAEMDVHWEAAKKL
jgi:XTP/dITP diphosphohydrolase